MLENCIPGKNISVIDTEGKGRISTNDWIRATQIEVGITRIIQIVEENIPHKKTGTPTENSGCSASSSSSSSFLQAAGTFGSSSATLSLPEKSSQCSEGAHHSILLYAMLLLAFYFSLMLFKYKKTKPDSGSLLFLCV